MGKQGNEAWGKEGFQGTLKVVFARWHMGSSTQCCVVRFEGTNALAEGVPHTPAVMFVHA